MSRKLPVGIQAFESLRKGQYMYVGKTEYIDVVNVLCPVDLYFYVCVQMLKESLFLIALL